MSHGRFRSFFTGALVGAGLGILLAPKEGNETRNDLKKSFSLLVDTIKNIDIEETKASLLDKVAEIRDELMNIDEVTASEYAKEKVDMVTAKCDELIETASKNNVPIVNNAALNVKENAVNMLGEFLKEVNAHEEEVVLEEKPKKKVKAQSKVTTSKTTKSKIAKKGTTSTKKTVKK